MNILKQLIDIANSLDKKGLHAEASIIDDIIREAEGFREQLAPGLMGPVDPTRMPPGAGAGGLPQVPPSVDKGTAGREEFVPVPKIQRFQRQFNQLYRKVRDLQIMARSTMREMFGRPLVVDGRAGPKTRAARAYFPQMQEIYNREMMARQGVANKRPEQTGPRGEPTGTPVTIEMPTPELPPEVDLGPKEEFKL